MPWVAGVDGFKSEWCVVLKETSSSIFRARVIKSFRELIELDEKPEIICVDIPIGLNEGVQRGGRECEILSRAVLKVRRSSVFSSIGREMLARPEDEYKVALSSSRSRYNIGFSAQSWGLAKKLADVDKTMTPALQNVVRECHPEVSFWAMADLNEMSHSKKKPGGRIERRGLLERSGFPPDFLRSKVASQRVPDDDFFDACAAAWTAQRILNGKAGRLPATVDLDSKGLDRAIWY